MLKKLCEGVRFITESRQEGLDAWYFLEDAIKDKFIFVGEPMWQFLRN